MLIDYVKNIDKNILKKVKRAGIILYARYNNDIWLGMGIDRVSGDISDFGGGVCKRDTDAIDGAIREFCEESLNIFGKVTRAHVNNCNCIIEDSMMIIFLPIVTDLKKSSKLFRSIMKKDSEMSSMIWIKSGKFDRLVKNQSNDYKIYERVRKIMPDTVNITSVINGSEYI